jgi:hypothetical protein
MVNLSITGTVMNEKERNDRVHVLAAQAIRV